MAENTDKTPLENNSDTIAEIMTLAENLPDASGGTDISLGVTGASVGDIVKVKAVDASGKPTAWEAATSASDWTKIGELTMDGTTFAISAYADGVITVTPNDGVYPTVDICRIFRKADYSSYILAKLYVTDTEGQYTMKNMDGGIYAPTDVDFTQYIIEEPDAESLTFSSIVPYVYHKARATMPLMACHGARASLLANYAPFNVYNVYAFNLGVRGCEVVFEICSSYSPEKLATKATWTSANVNTGTWDYLKITDKPSSPPTSIKFYSGSAVLAIGTRIELWGRNNED